MADFGSCGFRYGMKTRRGLTDSFSTLSSRHKKDSTYVVGITNLPRKSDHTKTRDPEARTRYFLGFLPRNAKKHEY